jgi:hypothetical protein
MDEIFQIILLIIMSVFALMIINKIINYFAHKPSQLNNRNKITETYSIHDNSENSDTYIQYYDHISRNIPMLDHPSQAWLAEKGLLSWWNSTRHTKNMSYDIRGDIPPFSYYTGPWNNSSLNPYVLRSEEPNRPSVL